MNNSGVIKFTPKKNMTPSIDNFNPVTGIQSVKTTIKSDFGIAELEEYFEDESELYKFKLQLKGLKPEVAREIIRVIKPFFEDPVSPQLTLFPEEK